VDEPVRVLRSVEAEASIQPADDALSFEAFVIEQHPRLYGALCVMTHDRYEAEEIAQEAFVRAFEKWDRVRQADDPAAYLFTTAMNVYRKRYRRAALALRRAVALAPRDDGFAAIEDREVVLQALAALPADQRAAFIVTALFGYPSEDAARILGARASTVRTRATRARAALREAIGEDR